MTKFVDWSLVVVSFHAWNYYFCLHSWVVWCFKARTREPSFDMAVQNESTIEMKPTTPGKTAPTKTTTKAKKTSSISNVSMSSRASNDERLPGLVVGCFQITVHLTK